MYGLPWADGVPPHHIASTLKTLSRPPLLFPTLRGFYWNQFLLLIELSSEGEPALQMSRLWKTMQLFSVWMLKSFIIKKNPLRRSAFNGKHPMLNTSSLNVLLSSNEKLLSLNVTFVNSLPRSYQRFGNPRSNLIAACQLTKSWLRILSQNWKHHALWTKATCPPTSYIPTHHPHWIHGCVDNHWLFFY